MRKSTALILLTIVSFLTDGVCTLCFAADAENVGAVAAAKAVSPQPSPGDAKPVQQINSKERHQGDAGEDPETDDGHAKGEDPPQRDENQDDDEDNNQHEDQTQVEAIA